jgi:hypothetical protein
LVVSGGAGIAGALNVGTDLGTKHIKGNSSAPSMAASTGAGTSPTSPSITGNDMSGTISFTTGSAPAVSAIVYTVTFNGAYGTAPIVVLTPGNAASAALVGATNVFVGAITTTNFTLNSNTTALVASTAYKWYYHVIQ